MKNLIRNYIAETAFVEPDLIKDETMLFEEGIFDSMGLLNLISFLEQQFGIVPQDVDLNEENFGSLGAITNFVNQKMS